MLLKVMSQMSCTKCFIAGVTSDNPLCMLIRQCYKERKKNKLLGNLPFFVHVFPQPQHNLQPL